MRYRVKARWWWDNELVNRFGTHNSEHELSGDQVVECIRLYGRASIERRDDDSVDTLYFENDHDN
jgi:hypothetical protein